MPDADRQLWERMLAHLRRHHTAISRQWFEDLTPLGIVRGTFLLRAVSGVHREYLAKTCGSAFMEAAQAASGHLLAVRFLGPEEDIVPGRPAASAPGAAAPGSDQVQGAEARRWLDATRGPEQARGPDGAGVPDAAPGLVEPKYNGVRERPGGAAVRPEDSLAINPDYSFDHFVVGASNRLAHAAALAAAEQPGRAYNPLFLHGGVGLGKTHLLQAICLKVLEANPGAVMYYVSCESFVQQFIEAVRRGEMGEFRNRFREVDVLVVDDIQFLARHERTQEEFFHTFNSLYQSQRQIVISSDAAPSEIPDLEDRLVSRFMWGLVVRIDRPDYETRAAIVKSKARMRGLSIPDDVAMFVAARVESNIRELEGAITKLDIQAQVEGRAIDLALARAALGEAATAPLKEPTVQVIQDVVTDFYRVRLLDLQSKKRPRSIALPRQVCMALARQFTRLSLEEIGGHFGNRDHTTVMHGIKAVEQRREQDPQFDAVIRSLEDRIRSAASGSPPGGP